jgi:cephalosporin hydroxylase
MSAADGRGLAGRAVDLAKRAYTGFYTTPAVARAIVSQFTRLYYQTPQPVRTWHDTRWLGHQVLKTPLDLWNYQEILAERRPDVVLECGTAGGGSALYLASVMDMIDHGRVVSVDLKPNPDRPAHPRVEYLVGSSTAPEVFDQMAAAAAGAGRVMVILDSDHSRDHVLAELRLYAPLVTAGDFLIVEDTCVNGHPVAPQHGPGPMEAVDQFLRETSDFVRDRRDRKFLMTFNPGGYLRRV